MVVVLGGCRSSVSTSAPPTAAPTPVQVRVPAGKLGVREIMDMFNRAVLLRAMTSARGYLSASLAATTPPMQLAALLGTRNIPLAAHYSILHVTGSQATVEVTYTFARGSVRDVTTLVRTHGTWRISAIRRR